MKRYYGIILLAAGLFFCYLVGVFAGRTAFAALPCETRAGLTAQASVFISQPSGPLAQGARPFVGAFLWAAALGLTVFGLLGVPCVLALRGMAFGQLLAAMSACGWRGGLLLCLFIVPVELLWLAPLVLQAMRSVRFSYGALRGPLDYLHYARGTLRNLIPGAACAALALGWGWLFQHIVK